MNLQQYKIRTLPTYEADLLDATCYIKDVLQNKTAAEKLIKDVESAIQDRSFYPFLFKPYPSRRKRKETYYPIYVHNYIVFYVVIGNVMEIRRIIYNKRNIEQIL